MLVICHTPFGNPTGSALDIGLRLSFCLIVSHIYDTERQIFKHLLYRITAVNIFRHWLCRKPPVILQLHMCVCVWCVCGVCVFLVQRPKWCFGPYNSIPWLLIHLLARTTPGWLWLYWTIGSLSFSMNEKKKCGETSVEKIQLYMDVLMVGVTKSVSSFPLFSETGIVNKPLSCWISLSYLSCVKYECDSKNQRI